MNSTPTKWPRDELAKLLSRALAEPLRVQCATPNDARKLRETLYKFRRSTGAMECRITLDGNFVVLVPTRNPILEDQKWPS